jgi:hypothetical protein
VANISGGTQMKKLVLVLVAFFMLLSFSAGYTEEPAKENKSDFPTEIIEVQAQTCPVMGGKINKDVFTIVGNRLYYFCCGGCIGAFEAEPEKFLKKLEGAEERVLKVTNEDGKCPVSQLEANLNFFKIDEESNTITFFHDAESMNKKAE